MEWTRHWTIKWVKRYWMKAQNGETMCWPAQTNLLRLSWRKPCSCHRWGRHNGTRMPRPSRSGRSSGEERRTPWGRRALCQPQTCGQNIGEHVRSARIERHRLLSLGSLTVLAHIDKSAWSLIAITSRCFFTLRDFTFQHSPICNHKVIAVYSPTLCRSLWESHLRGTGGAMSAHGVGKSNERQHSGQQAGRSGVAAAAWLQPWTRGDWMSLRHNESSVTCDADIRARSKRIKMKH